jgi:hypothetical protein
MVRELCRRSMPDGPISSATKVRQSGEAETQGGSLSSRATSAHDIPRAAPTLNGPFGLAGC